MRLIDADRALEIVRDQGIAHPNAYHLTNYATLILREAPTIEAEPVKHGRWLTWEEMFPGETSKRKNNLGIFCNQCRNHADNMSDYCPNCGAKMGDKLYG